MKVKVDNEFSSTNVSSLIWS